MTAISMLTRVRSLLGGMTKMPRKSPLRQRPFFMATALFLFWGMTTSASEISTVRATLTKFLGCEIERPTESCASFYSTGRSDRPATAGPKGSGISLKGYRILSIKKEGDGRYRSEVRWHQESFGAPSTLRMIYHWKWEEGSWRLDGEECPDCDY